MFALIYDAENPYFRQTGEWPGWPTALDETLNDVGAPVLFRSISWQELVQVLPLDESARFWASEKHGLNKTVA